MKFLENFPKLKQLSLSHNYLQGRKLTELEEMKNLIKLNLSDNPLNDVVLKQEIKELKYLKMRNIR